MIKNISIIKFFELNIESLDIDAETLGGLFIAKFGVIPKKGDKINLDQIKIMNIHEYKSFINFYRFHRFITSII